MIERDRKAIERIMYHIEIINEYMKPISNLNKFNDNSIIQNSVVFNSLPYKKHLHITIII